MVNAYNYYSRLSTSGTVTQSGSDPNVQLQLMNVNYNIGQLYASARLQDRYSFTVSFEMWNDSSAGGFGPGDGLSFFFGSSSATPGILSANGQYSLEMYMYQYNGGVPRGIHLYKNGTRVVTNTTTTWLGASTWYPVSLTFTRSPNNTVSVSFGGNVLYTYSDPNVETWWGSSGSFYGFGTGNGAATTNTYIRKFTVTLSPPLSGTLANKSVYTLRENCFLNKLSAVSQNNCTAAYSTRLLLATYTGPGVNVRRGSDNATQDFYPNLNGQLGTAYLATGISLTDWLGGATGYVVTWYDQSGFERDLTQNTQANQPTIASGSAGTNVTFNGSSQFMTTTSVPLTSGLKTYTMFANWVLTSTASTYYSIMEQNNTTTTSNQRAALLVSSNGSKYGFCGENNDTLSLIPITTNINKKTVMICNHNLNTGNVRIYDNGICYSGTTGNPSTLSVATNVFTVGKKSSISGEYFQGNINEAIVISNTIQDQEALLYFTPDNISKSKSPFPKPKLQLTFHPNTNTALPNNHGAVANCVLDLGLLNQSHASAVSNWNGFSQGTSANRPVYYNRGGWRNDMGYVNFDRTNSQHLNGGSKTFSIATNGGLTVVALACFTGTAGNWERIVDFSNDSSLTNSIILGRQTTTSNIALSFRNGTSIVAEFGGSAIVQNEWAVFAVRYNHSNRFTELFKNGFVVTSQTIGTALTDRTLASCLIGRPNDGAAYFNGQMAGVYVYDRYLSNTELSAVCDALIQNALPLSIPQHLTEYTNVYLSDKIVSVPTRVGYAGFFPGEANSFVDVQDIPPPPISYSFWFYATSSNYSTLVGLCDLSKSGNGIQVDYPTATNRLSVFAALPTAWSTIDISNVLVNTWYHLVVTLNTNYQVQVYLNGSYQNQVTGTALPPSRSRFVIGASGDGGRGYTGYIYDFRLYDYILRADEITQIYNSTTLQQITTANATTNYLVNCSNWYSRLQVTTVSGSYTPVQSGNDPNVQLQLVSSSVGGAVNKIYDNTRIQDYASFACSFEIYTSSTNGDALWFFVGANALTGVEVNANNGFIVDFQVYGSSGFASQGIALVNNSSTNVAASYYTQYIGAGIWVPVTVTYTRGTVNTWVVNVSGIDVITYSDTNNTSWLSSSGSYWGFGARTGGATMNAYIRRVELSYTPYTQYNSASLGGIVNNQVRYPEAALSANSSLNCVASSSSVFSGAQNYLAWKAFNYTKDSESIFASSDNTYNTSTGAYTGSVSTTVSGTSYAGEWVQIQLPFAIRALQYIVTCRPGYETTQSPNSWVLVGSTDGSTWTLLDSQSGISNWSSSIQSQTYITKNTSAFSYYRMICTVTGQVSNAIRNIFVLCELQLYGYPPLGVKYPITALTANTQTVGGAGPGTGTYVASASSVLGSTDALYGFNNDKDTFWHSDVTYNTSTGVYGGSVSTTANTGTYSGEWVQIQLPQPIRLSYFNIIPRQDSSFYAYRSPRSFVILGSNDASTWVWLYEQTNFTSWTANEQTFSVGSVVPYSYYRLVSRRNGNFDTYSGLAQNSVQIANWSLFDTTASAKSVIANNVVTPPGLIEGFTWKYFDTAPGITGADTLIYRNIGRTTDMTGINTATNGQYYQNWSDSYTIEWTGYFRANVTGTWTFEVYSDDDTWVWLGSTALAGYTNSNYLIYENAGHPGTRTNTIFLVAGVFYPFRMRFQEYGGYDFTNLAFTPPNGTKSNNGTGYFFSSTGTNGAFPAESAKVIKDLTGTNMDGVYYINVNGTSVATYCLMSDIYAGGGWMMLMKATRGTTFNYSANYWTSTNTLNPTQTNRNDGDAKFDTFNYSPIKDVMAIWPDISPTSYSNVFGKNGGSLSLPDGWCWKVDNWSSYTAVLNQLTSAGQSALRSAYALYRANNNYNGPMIQLRRLGDGATQDFYANLAGNLGTWYDAGGTSLSNWIGGSPQNIMNSNNWYSLMTSAAAGSQSGTDPYVQSQLVTGAQNQGGYWYSSNVQISTYTNLFFEAQVYWNGSGDLYAVNFGDTSANGGQGIRILFMFWSGYSNNGFSGTGIYILKSGVALAKSATSPNGAGANTWFNIQIIYNKSTTNTWQVNINGASALTYSDSSALTWAASAGNYFSISAYSGGGLQINVWYRQVNVTSNFAYVTNWYDQSGNGFHATQSTTSYQPILSGDSSGRLLIDSQLTTTQFLNMGNSSSGPIPTGSSSYTLILRHGSLSTNTGALISAGNSGTNNQSNVIRGGSDGGYAYYNYWWNNDLGFGTNSRPAGNTVAVTWDGTTRKGYVVTNGAISMTSVTNSNTPSPPNVAVAQQYLFRVPGGEYLNGQLYHAFVFNTALGTSDLTVLTNAQNFSQSSSSSSANSMQQRCTALSGLQISRDSHPSNPLLFNGYSSSVFSNYNSGMTTSRHVLGGGGHVVSTTYPSLNVNTRWGILFNENNSGDFGSCDNFSGIGVGGTGSYSAGDTKWILSGTGLNRTMRVEMYGR